MAPQQQGREGQPRLLRCGLIASYGRLLLFALLLLATQTPSPCSASPHPLGRKGFPAFALPITKEGSQVPSLVDKQRTSLEHTQLEQTQLEHTQLERTQLGQSQLQQTSLREAEEKEGTSHGGGRDILGRKKPLVYQAEHQAELQEGSRRVAQGKEGLPAVHSHQAQAEQQESSGRAPQAKEGALAARSEGEEEDPPRSQRELLSGTQARPVALPLALPMLDGEEDSTGGRQVDPQETAGSTQDQYELSLSQGSTRVRSWTISDFLGEGKEEKADGEPHIGSKVYHTIIGVPRGLWGAFMRCFGWPYGEQGPSEGEGDEEGVTGAIYWVQPAGASYFDLRGRLPAVERSYDLRGRLHQLLMSDDIDADLDEVLAYIALGDMDQME